MINHVKRKDLDIIKYNFCIENSLQSRIYAFSWYLDIVADNWDVLVLNDYEAVMPLPWRKKYFIKYVYQPLWTQQLGVFSIKQTSSKILKKFISNIPVFFKKVRLQLNSDNKLSFKSKIERENFILNLNEPHQDLFKNFLKGRKHAIKVGEKLNLDVKVVSIKEIINTAKEFYNLDFLLNKECFKLEKLAEKGTVLGVYNLSNEFLGGALFLKDSKRITYLFSAFTSNGKKQQASSFLINHIIKQNINCDLCLDFEGSMIEGIASFYRSFGAKSEKYQLLEYTTFSKVVRFFKH